MCTSWPCDKGLPGFSLSTCWPLPTQRRRWSGVQDKMQEYKGQGIVLQGDTNNNNLFKAS